MEIDYIADSLMVLAAIGGCMMACAGIGWVIEELLPRAFPRFAKILDRLMGLDDDDV